jgi:hypothetical protein
MAEATHPQRQRATVVAVVLVAVSIATWFVLRSDAYHGTRIVGAALLVIGLIKAGLVGYEYMDVRHAPLVLRAIFGAWLVLTGALVLATLYA